MMRSKATLCLASLATLLLLFVMLFPRRHLGQIDLGNPELEASVFALCMLLWLVARAGRWRSDPYFVFRSNVWDVDVRTFGHNIVTGVVEFVIVAAILQVVKTLVPDRHADIRRFLLDAGTMVTLGMSCYIALVLLLRSPRGRRFIAKLR